HTIHPPPPAAPPRHRRGVSSTTSWRRRCRRSGPGGGFSGDAPPGLPWREEPERRQVGLRAPRAQHRDTCLARNLPGPGNGGPGPRRGGTGLPREVGLPQLRRLRLAASHPGFHRHRRRQEGGGRGRRDVSPRRRQRDGGRGRA
ncbi:unnamed protein product, partial [Linum tenue]